jgi:hypothetical protein
MVAEEHREVPKKLERLLRRQCQVAAGDHQRAGVKA